MIRKFESKDRANVQDICIETSNNFMGGKFDILLALYCNYYIDLEKEHVFVTTNDKDEATGYILCASDYERYVDLYTKNFLPVLKELSDKIYQEKLDEFDQTKELAKAYPAHLHIDLTKDARGGGEGSKLIKTLEDCLISEGVKGIMLGVSEDNVKAHKFYEKNGYQLIDKEKYGWTYGKKLIV